MEIKRLVLRFNGFTRVDEKSYHYKTLPEEYQVAMPIDLSFEETSSEEVTLNSMAFKLIRIEGDTAFYRWTGKLEKDNSIKRCVPLQKMLSEVEREGYTWRLESNLPWGYTFTMKNRKIPFELGFCADTAVEAIQEGYHELWWINNPPEEE